ncbi:MAG: hypothetical protein Pg6C_15500 [Treponemataceae bacterium]|nr:MAG: hypothetical protein Pg6C_15500 [Treponemataceae bacterium]
MQYKQCACCGNESLDAGSKYDYCPLCGWQDDPIQNDEPGYRGGANLISLNEAKQVVAAGKDLRDYKKAAKQRRREERLKEMGADSVEPINTAALRLQPAVK